MEKLQKKNVKTGADQAIYRVNSDKMIQCIVNIVNGLNGENEGKQKTEEQKHI